MTARRMRLGVRMVLAAAILAACAPTPSPSVTPSPLVRPTTSAPSPAPSTSPPAETVTCRAETGPLPSGLAGDPCPSAVAAVRAVVEPLGTPIVRIYIEPGPFFCGDLWPGVGSPPVCFGPLVLPGTRMHGWVIFVGTDQVAAVALSRPLPGRTNASPVPSWTATLQAFVVPPTGWVMP